MATEQELEEIRHRIDIIDLVGNYVTLKKSGANHKALCPFHEEKTGSFMVSSQKQIFKCFGCNEGGNVFNFIMKMEGLTFPEAVQFLANRAGVTLAKTSFTPSQPNTSQQDKNTLFAINDLAAKYYQTILTTHPAGAQAKQYLYKRGITDTSIKDFRLGYAPSQRALEGFLLKKDFSSSAITASGKPDRFTNRIMFPIFDAIGNIIAFTGREFPEGPGPKYYNTAETALFHKSRAIYGLNYAKTAIHQKQSVIFVEGQMDVIASHQSGVKNVVASSGTALTLDHLKIMYRYAQHFILAFDNDEAGQKATEKIIEMTLAENYPTDVIILPKEYKDAGEIIEKAPDLWPKLVSQAIPAIQWHFQKINASFDSSQLDARQQQEAANRLLPLINKVQNPLEKRKYLQKLSKMLDSTEKSLQPIQKFLEDELAKLGSVTEKHSATSNIISEKLTLHEQIIANFINFPKLVAPFSSSLNEQYFPLQFQSIVKALKTCYNELATNRDMVQNQFVSSLRDRLNESENLIIDKIINASLSPTNELGEENQDADSISVEIKQSLEHIHANFYEDQKSDFAREIADAENSGDREKVKDLLKQLQIFISTSGGK